MATSTVPTPAGAQACYDLLTGLASIDTPIITAVEEPGTDVLDYSNLDRLLADVLDRFGHDSDFRRALANYLHMVENGGQPSWDMWTAEELYSYYGSRPAVAATMKGVAYGY